MKHCDVTDAKGKHKLASSAQRANAPTFSRGGNSHARVHGVDLAIVRRPQPPDNVIAVEHRRTTLHFFR